MGERQVNLIDIGYVEQNNRRAFLIVWIRYSNDEGTRSSPTPSHSQRLSAAEAVGSS